MNIGPLHPSTWRKGVLGYKVVQCAARWLSAGLPVTQTLQGPHLGRSTRTAAGPAGSGGSCDGTAGDAPVLVQASLLQAGSGAIACKSTGGFG